MVSHFPCLILSKKEAFFFFVKILWFNLVNYELNVWKNNNFIWASDLRCLPLIENMVTIYRSLDAAFSASILQSRSGMVSYTLI